MRCSLLAFVLLLCGCAKPVAPGYKVLAVLPFEELGGDVRGDALRLALVTAFQGQRELAVAIPNHRRELPETGATAVVEGYATPDGLHLTFNHEPMACIGEFAVCAEQLATGVATKLGVNRRALSDLNEWIAHAKARKENTEAAWRALLAAYPRNVAGWTAVTQTVAASRGREAALAELKAIPPEGRDALETAQLRLLRSEANPDPAAKAKAIVEFAKLNPADLPLQQRAADACVLARDYAGAVALLDGAIALRRDPLLVNQAIYAAAFAGDRAKVNTFAAELLRSGRPQYVDSAAETAYFFGDFAEAARRFEEVLRIDAAFQNGEGQWRYAEALRAAGKEREAEQAFAVYVAMREKAGQDGGVLRAMWVARREPGARSPEQFLRSVRKFQPLFPPGSGPAAMLKMLLDGPPPQAPGLAAVYWYGRGETGRAKEFLMAAEMVTHPYLSMNLRQLEWRITGKRPGMLLPRPDDLLSALL